MTPVLAPPPLPLVGMVDGEGQDRGAGCPGGSGGILGARQCAMGDGQSRDPLSQSVRQRASGSVCEAESLLSQSVRQRAYESVSEAESF